MENEIIICAAVRYNDKVWRGHRHGNAIEAQRDEMSYSNSRKQLIKLQINKDQGFITSKNRYVGREEAWELAKAAGQIIERKHQTEGYLYSEDLY